MSDASRRVSPVAVAAVGLIILQFAVRAVLAFGGYYYWDDLILVGRAGTQPLLSPGNLLTDHDGHVMPAAFLLSGVITRAAPLVWIWPAISLLALQLLASLALLRALWVSCLDPPHLKKFPLQIRPEQPVRLSHLQNPLRQRRA